ncbi:MAG: type IV pilus secretin PilQ [Proteobacteria bacterium]|nr:type IV pilus secretin PilQ [Pseudomonadota bacterium]
MRPWFYKYKLIFYFLSLMFIIAGCSSHDKKVDRFDKWEALAENSQPVTPVPKKDIFEVESTPSDKTLTKVSTPGAQAQQPTLPEIQIQLPKIPVTMRMHAVSVPVVLRTLARIANINIILNESITGLANVDIKNVPWDQAFLSLIDAYGLAYEWSGQILRVVTVEDLNVKKALLEAKQGFEQSKKNHDVAMSQIKKKQALLEPLLTKIVKIHYADLKVMQINLEQYLKGVKKEGEGENSTNEKIESSGSILIDEFSNSLILQATKADINKIMPIINELDKPIKQVRIEAHIVEANSDIAKELGIQWGGVGLKGTSDNNRYSIGGDMTSVSGSPMVDDVGNAVAYDPNAGAIVNLPITSIASGQGLALGILAENIGSFRLYAQLSALEKQGELNILSKPSITTMDHRKAIIKSGKEVPFQTVVDGTVTIQFKEAVIKLEVVPHIIDDNIIRLEIVTHKDELDWSNPVNGNPTIITKNAETRVTLFDGQTTVIGGLNKERFTDGESGVPGLKNIPGLGWLFKSTNNTKEMEELLIFITPHVLKEQNYTNKTKN